MYWRIASRKTNNILNLLDPWCLYLKSMATPQSFLINSCHFLLNSMATLQSLLSRFMVFIGEAKGKYYAFISPFKSSINSISWDAPSDLKMAFPSLTFRVGKFESLFFHHLICFPHIAFIFML